MSMGIRHERPGVYSSYETSGLTAANAGGGKVAVIAEAGEAEPGKVFQWTSYSRAAADVGECALSLALNRMDDAVVELDRNGHAIPAAVVVEIRRNTHLAEIGGDFQVVNVMAGDAL